MKNSHTTTLFHYTRGMDTLLSILKNGLKFSYAKENFGRGRVVGIPMISFCDIPLSQSGEHKSKYGNYAIGLSKELLLKEFGSALNPVMYCVNDRQFNAGFKLRKLYIKNQNQFEQSVNDAIEQNQAKQIVIQGNTYNSISISKEEMPQYYGAINAFFENLYLGKYSNSLLGYMKPYFVQRNGKKYVAYDECEWRMVMPENAQLTPDHLCPWIWEDFDSWKKSRSNKFVDYAPVLNIKPEMLSYIIVPSIDKADRLLEQIKKRNIFGDKSANICSKIISFEQIEKDF